MTTLFRAPRVSLCSQFSLAFLTAIVGSLGTRADEPYDITVNVDPGFEYTSNVAAGFKVVEREGTELKIKLTTSKGTIVSSALVDVAAGAKWDQVDGDPTRWKCTGVGPNDKFWCVIKCTIKPDAKPQAPGKGEADDLDRWMSVSDIDFDADSDNDSRGVHRPPSRTTPEDFDEYPVSLSDVPIGFVIPIDDDNEVNTTARDGGLPAMNYDKDTHVLDGVIDITPKKGGTWDITPRDMCWYRQDGTTLLGSNRKLAIDDPNRTMPVRVKSKWNAATGTRGTGDASIVSTYTLDAAKAGHTPEDKMNYVILGCDIDVDSNNDGTIAGANQDATGEDFWEALPRGDAQYSMYPEYANGMIVGVNDGDADKDGNPDNGWNGIGWVGPNANVVEDDAPLRPGVLRGLGISDAAKAALELHNPFVQITMIAGDGDVRLFSADAPKTVIGTFVNVGNTAFTFGGKSIWDRVANNDLHFQVEGLGSGEVMLACQLLLNGVVIHQDVVRITVVGIDLDIDSDNDSNNNGFGPPGRTFAEDQIEDVANDRTKPGKIVIVNDDNTDEDLIPDFADGFNKFGGTSDRVAGEKFVPLMLELRAPIDLTKARLKITYDASDPDGVKRTGKGTELDPFIYTPAAGRLRLWKLNDAASRNRASVKTSPTGNYVPPGTYDDVSTLGLSSSNRTITLYVEGIAASETVADQQIKVELDPDGDGPAGYINVDAVRVTVVKIDLDASPNSIEATEEVPGTPVLFNDNWDCKKKYGAGAGGDHRELEPIWDMDYTAAEVPDEKDLMQVRLSVTPATLLGDVTLKIASGGSLIRLWPRATKGAAAEIIAIPAAGQVYGIDSLPKDDIYVEGVALGRSVMTLEHTIGTTTYTDKLNIDVVGLHDSQGGPRKVINGYDSDVAFQVFPTALDAKYKYAWDLDGDGKRKNGDWENDENRTTSVKYSDAPSGPGNVFLEPHAKNRRQEYALSVKLKPAELAGGLVVPRTIRMALGTYEGGPVAASDAATNDAARRTEVAGLTVLPVRFLANTPPGGPTTKYSQAWFEAEYGIEVSPPGVAINDGNRLQYATRNISAGIVPFSGRGDDRRVYIAMVGEPAYRAGFKKEDLESVALHERQHIAQNIAIALGGTDWRAVDDALSASDYENLAEAEAYGVELSANGSWRFIALQSDFAAGKFRYPVAMFQYDAMPPGPAKLATKRILQKIYDDIPFLEMKRRDYNWYVRAPR